MHIHRHGLRLTVKFLTHLISRYQLPLIGMAYGLSALVFQLKLGEEGLIISFNMLRGK